MTKRTVGRPAQASDFRLLPVTSIDQLFFQAKVLHPIFRRKVQQLARSSGGGGCAFPSAPGANSFARDAAGEILMGSSGLVYLEARDPRAGGSLSEGILWGSIKSVNRAMEKAIRVYKQVPAPCSISVRVL